MIELNSDDFKNTYKVSKLKITSDTTIEGDDVSRPEEIRTPGETFAINYLNTYLYNLIQAICIQDNVDRIYIISESYIGFFNCFHGTKVQNIIGYAFNKENFIENRIKNEKICILCDITATELYSNTFTSYFEIFNSLNNDDIFITVSSLLGFSSGENNLRSEFSLHDINIDLILEISGPNLIVDRLPDYQEFSDFSKFIYFTKSCKNSKILKEFVKEVNLFYDNLEFLDILKFGNILDNSSLSNGQLLEPNEYKGRINWYARKKIFSLINSYENFQISRIGDLLKAVKIEGKILSSDNYSLVKLPLNCGAKLIDGTIYFTSGYIDKSLIDKDKSTFDRMVSVQLEIDDNTIDPNYFFEFLHSSFGRLIRDSHFCTNSVYLNEYLDMPIYFPNISEQKNSFTSFRKYENFLVNIRNSFFNISFDSFLKPNSRIDIENKIDNVSSVIGSLGDLSRIKNLISAGESDRLEFKQTFSMDIKTKKKEKYIEDSAIKTIAAFLNSKGGNLLCGVDDNGALIGLNDEIKLFYKSSDAFLLHVKNVIKQRIGSEFYPFINFKLMDNADIIVLEFTCSFSNIPVFVDEKDFYVRTNPATDKLEGRKQFEYISNRFK
jgi:hypothetical protein